MRMPTRKQKMHLAPDWARFSFGYMLLLAKSGEFFLRLRTTPPYPKPDKNVDSVETSSHVS